MSFIFEKIYSLIYNLIINLISYYLGERYRMILLKLTPKIGTIKRFTDVLLPTWNIKNFNNFNVTITEIGFAKCERNFFIKHISDKRPSSYPLEIIQVPHRDEDFYSLPFTLRNKELIEIACADMREIEYVKNNGFHYMYIEAGDSQFFADASKVLSAIDTTKKTYREKK